MYARKMRILDRATFQDDSSFVVFSIIECDKSEDHNIENIYPCKSKVIELISRTKPELYRHLKDNGDVKDMDYVSMSLAEFEAGPEEAEKRKKLAEAEKQRMEREKIKTLMMMTNIQLITSEWCIEVF
ncbi:hypothetical protein C9374_004661 [Naegleria lovaniensis]|uniref:Uncharacterized protein n=1 Tax=Naegleria lovaniensis TaxID=51637 RepID=A0AA88GLT9_NAELO|nr:uncharacterized protein C9374_004661 [Naegleria lovaniensis]KAG2383324.1 hypothetical protein C9374_004661 [Naegleria lovaniensis]